MELPIERYTRTAATSWMARIGVGDDGRLLRQFAPKAETGYYDVCDWLRPGVPIEFGSNDRNARGKVQGTERWYGVVVGVTEGVLHLAKVKGPKTAVKRARNLCVEFGWQESVPVVERRRDYDYGW